MILQGVNLREKLLVERQKTVQESNLLEEIKSIFEKNNQERSLIKKKLASESSTKQNEFNFDLLDTDNIFHINTIKSVCIDYRLRFLDSNLFKSTIPEEAITKVKELEKKHNTQLNGFKIMAPSKLFHLIKADDPLLFVPMGNDYYYLVHKWGNDLSWYRKLSMRPFKNLGSFFFTLIMISLLCASVTPQNILGRGISPDIFFALSFLFIFKSFCGIALYYCFWKGKNFNEEIWNSTYYN
jgi:hypothetical protein